MPRGLMLLALVLLAVVGAFTVGAGILAPAASTMTSAEAQPARRGIAVEAASIDLEPPSP